jgi:hypothetical protein
MGSPVPGCSTLMTSAPSSPRAVPTNGPAPNVAASMTRTPESAPDSACDLGICNRGSCCSNVRPWYAHRGIHSLFPGISTTRLIWTKCGSCVHFVNSHERNFSTSTTMKAHEKPNVIESGLFVGSPGPLTTAA